MTYDLIMTLGTALLLIWFVYRIFHPFTCSCGHQTWFAHRFVKHIYTKHQATHPKP